MELIKHILEYQKDGLVSCLLFTSLLLPTVLAAVLSPTVLPNDIGETPEPENIYPCKYGKKGETIILHGQTIRIDECITCTCNNLTLTCNIAACPPLHCGRWVLLDGECCKMCEYYVPIYEVKAENLNNITEREVNNIAFDLNLKIHAKGISVAGQGLWKLGVWGSNSSDGDGERISYQEQVLTEEQAATKLIKPPYYRSFEFNISNITYSLDGTNATCSEMEFLCYEFNKGDDPYPKDPRLPFTVEGVAEEDDLRIDTVPQPENLRGCTRFATCFKESVYPCSYLGGEIVPHGQELIVDDCTTCVCNNLTLKCNTLTCPSVFCGGNPVALDGLCCKLCGNYVPIYEVNAENLNNISEGEVNNITFDLNMKMNAEGNGVDGQALWKLGVWGSDRADGDGERISYQEQVLTEDQAATNLIRPRYFGGYDFNIRNVTFSFNGTSATCSEMEFLCYEFHEGDDPYPQEPRLNFTVEGVAGEDDLTPAPQNLRGCTRFSTCITDKSVSENTVQACDNIPEGQEDDFLFDIRVAVRSAGINERGEKSWNVNVLGVNVVTSGDND